MMIIKIQTVTALEKDLLAHTVKETKYLLVNLNIILDLCYTTPPRPTPPPTHVVVSVTNSANPKYQMLNFLKNPCFQLGTKLRSITKSFAMLLCRAWDINHSLTKCIHAVSAPCASVTR